MLENDQTDDRVIGILIAHLGAFCSGELKRSSNNKRIIFLENYDPTPLYMCKGLSGVNCIKPEGSISMQISIKCHNHSQWITREHCQTKAQT